MIWHSLAEDDANNALNLAPSSPADEAVSPPLPIQNNPPTPGDVPLRDHQSRSGSGSSNRSNSTVVVSPGADDRSGNNQSSEFTGARSMQEKGSSDVNNYLGSGRRHLREANQHDVDGVLPPSNKQNNTSREDDAKRANRHQGWADGVAPDTGTTVGAACALASDLSRLASRHGELAFGLLHVVSEGRGSDPCSFAGLPEEMAALGQSVGLQASAVGLMEEVVVRTVHSRVRDGINRL